MRICDKLGKFPSELEEKPCEEYDRLLVFYLYEAQEEAKANKKNKLNPNNLISKRGL